MVFVATLIQIIVFLLITYDMTKMKNNVIAKWTYEHANSPNNQKVIETQVQLKEQK